MKRKANTSLKKEPNPPSKDPGQDQYDAVTGFPNHPLLYDRLVLAIAQANRYGKTMGILLLDLDCFQRIQDGIGTEHAHFLIHSVASRIKGRLRETDTVSRYREDTFILILTDVRRLQDLAFLAQGLLETLSEPFVITGKEYHITASIGISVFPMDGENSDSLLEHAEDALTEAKQLGRCNHQFFSAKMNAFTFEKISLEISLREAISKKEFVLFYQPRFDTRKNRITGVEALVRWMRPGFGLLEPSEFIPIAEETGLIIPIGEWIFREACIQHQKWTQQGIPPLTMAVNVSVAQFLKQDMVEMAKRIFKETGMDAKQFELEITESMTMSDGGIEPSTLENLSALGLEIAIDDFGTGYSSLSYLKKYPIHTLKIDQSFVRGLLDDNNDATICSAIIALARGLKLKVIAEGVEKKEQVTRLNALKCFMMQGLLFGAPFPEKKITALLKSQK